MSPEPNKDLTVKALEPTTLEPSAGVSSTDRPVREDVRRTIAAVMKRDLAEARRSR